MPFMVMLVLQCLLHQFSHPLNMVLQCLLHQCILIPLQSAIAMQPIHSTVWLQYHLLYLICCNTPHAHLHLATICPPLQHNASTCIQLCSMCFIATQPLCSIALCISLQHSVQCTSIATPNVLMSIQICMYV